MNSAGCRRTAVGLIALLGLVMSGLVHAQPANRVDSFEPTPAAKQGAAAALQAQEWASLDDGVQRALQWLSKNQQRDGSFPTLPQGQPGVTSLCALAFLAHGHQPGQGEYGQLMQSAVDFVLSCQQQNGLLARYAPQGKRIARDVDHEMGTTAVYNHAIGSLLLGEVYGMAGPEQAARIQPVIEKSVQVTLAMQRWSKQRGVDKGGWRYLHHFPINGPVYRDSDLTVTGWQLMFLRSAKNAGFDVPEQAVVDAIRYVKACANPANGDFNYTAGERDKPSRGASGAAILALAHAGYHNSPEALRAGDWILKYPFDLYNTPQRFPRSSYQKDRYHYSVFECSYAMYQLGGKYWDEFFPRTVRTLLANQSPNGSWAAERYQHDSNFGESYTTALVLLTLGTPNQLLPVFQR